MDPRLQPLADQLESTGWAAELCDADWRLVWVSSQLRSLLKAADDHELGLGEHVIASRARAAWERTTTPRTRRDWLEMNVPAMLDDDGRGEDPLALAREHHDVEVGDVSAYRLPVWTAVVDSVDTELSLGRVRYFGGLLRDGNGERLGAIFIYGSTLPAALLSLVARGDRNQFERMARLVDPGRRQAAILFADLQASGSVSRHLSSSAYFSLVQRMWSEGDRVVIRAGGIVGKHAGDGVTAFFLTGDGVSASQAAAASIRAARRLVDTARECGAPFAAQGTEVLLNMALHWGGNLYMGQIITGGRLEVTALGDEVNQAARIQQVARDGAILASKPLLEHLEPDEAAALDIDPAQVRYVPLEEFAGVDEKAVRDAGLIPLSAL